MNGKAPHERLRAGIARTFQNIRLFPNLTVWQNLWVAQNSPRDIAAQGFLSRWFGATRRTRRELMELLELADLGHKGDELASNLAFGEQRRLEFARAAAARPQPAAAGRAGGGHEPPGDRGSRRADPLACAIRG